MGEVYRADDLKQEQPVALKFLPRGLEQDLGRLERFFSEVRVARQVSHPAVCRFYDVSEAEGQHFISMEFVDGENLSSLLRRIGRLPPDKARDIARQLCAGLAAAHERGVLHRDLKPANVMLDGQGNVRITDFGLAGLAEALGPEEARSGTPAYMSPEQLLGQEVTVRSDVYALGLLLFELYTGRRTFDGKTLAELARRHRDERPVEPSALVPDLAPAVERTILACLEKDPRRRPPSASAVAAMLDGRDPLEAAIAAGDTPSPELVAAAGEVEGLRPRTAWACLAAVVASVLLVPLLVGRLSLFGLVPVTRSPAALEDRARDLLARVVAGGPAADRASGFGVDKDFFWWQRQRDRSPGRWDGLATGIPPVLHYWYRESPRPLAAIESLGARLGWADPPALLSGMAGVRYDLQGRLVSFYLVPPQRQDVPRAGAGAAADFSALFAEARLDPALLHPVEPAWFPPFFSDHRAAWEGAWPERPEVPLRVEAAAFAGRPAWFQVMGPWTMPERQQTWAPTPGQRVSRAFMVAMLCVILVGGGVLAKRNLSLGRGDRQGAFRLATVIMAFGVLGRLLGADHVADASGEILLLVRGLGLIVLVAMLVWLFYLAIEPYVRRQRPWTLVSWTRLLGGGFGDAVVGRDVLIGFVWGGLVNVVVLLLSYLPRAVGQPGPPPEAGWLDALLSLRYLLHYVVSLPLNTTFYAMGLLLLFLVLRLIVRRDAPAALLLVLVLSAPSLAAQTDLPRWLGVPVTLVFAGSLVGMLLRFGLLSTVAGVWLADLVAAVPHSLELGSWKAAGTAVVLPLVIGLALAAFRVALGGAAGHRPSARA
jgi:serine/threonine-protein kinase